VIHGFAVPNQRSRSYLFDYLKLKKKPVIFLPNTVDGDFYTKPDDWNSSDTKRVKRNFGINEESRICIQVSQIEDRKGVRELVHYWQKLSPRKRENYSLVFVGEGSLRSELSAYCKEHNIGNIIFTGNQPKEKVRELLFSSDFFMLFTKNDPNPLTLIEASFAGLPLLTTRFAGNNNELVFDSRNGVTINDLTFDEFEEGFVKLKELALNKETGSFSLNNAKKNFDINIVATKLLFQLSDNISITVK
jgi:glycosyltransferase involved in cell wall biosynthesis